VLRSVVSAISPDEVSKSFVTLTEIGEFDGATIYFLNHNKLTDEVL